MKNNTLVETRAIVSTIGYRPPKGISLTKGSFIPLHTPSTTHSAILLPYEQLNQLVKHIEDNISAILFYDGWHDVAVFEMSDDASHIILFLHDKSGWTKNEVDVVLNGECSKINPLFYDTLVPESRGNSSGFCPESLCDGFASATTPSKIRFEMSRQFNGDLLRKNAFAYMTGVKLDDEINNPSSPIILQMSKEYDLHPSDEKLRGFSRSSVIFNTIYDKMYNRIKTCLEEEDTSFDNCDVAQITNLMMERNVWSFTGSEDDATRAIRQDLDTLSGIF